MEIVSNKEEMIFRNEYNGKVSYQIGLSKKDKDGKFISGYVPVNFKKGIDLKNKTKIKIKNAWLDFYKKDKATIPTIFISEFDITEEPKEENPFEEFGNSIKTDFDVGGQIEITDDDMPF